MMYTVLLPSDDEFPTDEDVVVSEDEINDLLTDLRLDTRSRVAAAIRAGCPVIDGED